MSANGKSSTQVAGVGEMKKFDALFEELVTELTVKNFPGLKVVSDWFKEVLYYNVPHGKKHRGMTVVTSYKLMVPDAKETDLKIACVLGWCVELLQAFFLVLDDVMDHSLTRRGQPCWYKKENVGMMAINDGFFMESCIYSLLKKYVRGKPYYLPVMELLLETTLQTSAGQCIDMATALPEAEVDFTNFTMERYSSIVEWKTAYYSFYLPVALAMLMAGVSDEDSLNKAKTILIKLGHFFQVQDDYLDCYGDPEFIGKIGTDIQDNKCSWLIVKALELATPQQKLNLKDCYGRWDEDAVRKVKAIYNDLKLEKVFKEYEERSYKEIMDLIKKMDVKISQEIFLEFANKMYKRQK